MDCAVPYLTDHTVPYLTDHILPYLPFCIVQHYTVPDRTVPCNHIPNYILLIPPVQFVVLACKLSTHSKFTKSCRKVFNLFTIVTFVRNKCIYDKYLIYWFNAFFNSTRCPSILCWAEIIFFKWQGKIFASTVITRKLWNRK